MNADAFEQLLDSYRLGQTSPGEMAELERLLQGAAWRRALVEHFLLEAQLHKVFALAAAPKKARRGRWLWVGGGGLAAAVAVLLTWVGLMLSTHRPDDSPGDHNVPGNEIVSGKVSIKGEVVTRVPDGTRFQVIGSEPALIDLPDGSHVELAPSSEAALRGPEGDLRQIVELAEGGGKFRISPGGGRFQVRTPAGTITVLGTAFTARLQRWTRKKAKGLAVAVEVQEGSVQVEAGGKSRTLAAGDKHVFGKPREDDDDD